MNGIINKNLFIILGVVGLMYLIMSYFSDILMYVVISIVLATILRPFVNYISQFYLFKVKVPRVVAVLMSYLVLITLFTLFVTLFIPLVSEQIQVISSIDFELLLNKAIVPIQSVEDFVIENNFTDQKHGFILKALRENLLFIIQELDVSTFINYVISFMGTILVTVMAVSFITFFLLYENGLLRKGIISLMPNRYFELAIAAFYKIEKLLSNYILGLLFQMVAVFSIVALGLTLVGVKYALTIAIFAALANLIPYVGPMLGASFGIIVGLSLGQYQNGNDYLWLVINIGVVFGVVQLTDNVLLQPIIFSKSVKAHPLEIFIVIFAGASLAGIVGMILAIPTYTILRVSVSEFYKGYKAYRVFSR